MVDLGISVAQKWVASSAGNVAFSVRRGFAVTGEVDVARGGPHVWAMTRPPGA